ncbi:MAG: DPP IV N-terminal domain-containing protein [Mediterranea sp.]|jgi:dipeptidyl-peptidase-4|nr:DPP IV N-terminal domain-containing protein [Mediterranea sp.]
MKKTLSNLTSALLLALLTVGHATAQTPNKPTLEDLIPGGTSYRYTESIYGLQWWGDVCIMPAADSLFTVDPKNGEKKLLVTREAVNAGLTQAGESAKLPQLYNVQTPWSGRTQLLMTLQGNYVVYDWKTNSVVSKRAFPRQAANRDYNLESGNLAYTIGNNLYVNDRQITDEPQGVVCGQSVHRNEFGINKGTFWSPKGTLLAFYRMDESMVTEYPLVDITARVGKLNNVRYPMVGMTSHKVTVGIYNPATEKTVYLNAGDPTDRYFTNIAWAPDQKSIYLIELNRDQNHAKLCQYNAETGEPMGVLFEETHPKYVEPQHPIVFLPWDSSRFIYQSQRDGFNHLYIYNTQGKLLKQLTQGAWLVQDILGFDTAKKELYIASTEVSPLQTNVYKVNVANGKRTLMGNNEGVHRAQLSGSCSYLIDSYSTPTVPRSINLLNTRNGRSVNLLTAEDPYKGFDMPTVEVGTIKAADDSTDLYYRITRPADFDPSKKYPVMVYVYGGPHAQMITAGYRYGAGGYHIYMANRGYIVFSLDNRGSSNRGLEFENCTFRHLGIKEGEDQVRGVEFLKSLPYVDAKRIGVHGWSFGGHMTTALMLRYPDLFKVGVAGGPVIDWAYYEVMYGERYMDTPQANPEGYKECNLNNLAGKLQGDLLLIHDDHDDTCVPQHTLSFIKACVDARTYPDLFIYPGHKHNVSGRDRVHLHEKITRYFDDNL